MKKKQNKVNFLASKLYIWKLADEYKIRWYEKIFLDNDFDFLDDIKSNIKKINNKNTKIDTLINKMTNFIQKISSNDKLDKKTKKLYLENALQFFWDFVWVCDLMIETEETIIENIDRFRNIEKEIDIKTMSLTKYGFDKEFCLIFDNLLKKKHKEISLIIFDQNNLKNINESFWHEIWQESIWKFWSILRDELEKYGFNYILSNYFGWDEWFLILIDLSQKKTIDFIKKIFTELKNNTYKIKNLEIKLWTCAWISHFHPQKNFSNGLLNPKLLSHITDTLLLQAKIQKNKNKSWFAYKALNVSNISKEELDKIYTNIQILPKKLKKETLESKKLIELFEIRKNQNEKIMKARTLWVKKILRYNIDIINEIIWYKIIDQISKTLYETKEKITNFLPYLIEKISENLFFALEKKYNSINLSLTEKDEIMKNTLESNDVKKFLKTNVEWAFSENIFSLEKKILSKNKTQEVVNFN